MTPVKQSKDINVDTCVENVGGNQFHLVLIAATRAKEIANSRNTVLRNDPHHKFGNKTVAAALQEVESKKIGREYLEKVGKVK